MGIRNNLVLGGAGLIGRELQKQLLLRGEKVINLDIKNGFDIRSNELEEYRNVDYVWLLAWEVGGAKFLTNEKNLLTIIHNNTLICERAFAFLEKSKLPFMFASSQLAGPDTAYGVTKLLGEEWTRLLHGQIVRFWNVYGWEEPDERSHVIPDLILQGLTNGKIEMMTDGLEERQFIHTTDCARNMITIADNKEPYVDLTNNDWKKIIDIAQLIGKILNVPVIPGKKTGYNNKISAKQKPFLNFEIPIERGLESLIVEAKKYLSLKIQ